MILLLDFEATAKEPELARTLEIGAQWVTDDFKTVVDMYSQLTWESGYPALTPEVSKITGIDLDLLMKGAITPRQGFQELMQMLAENPVEAIITYNRHYDQTLFEREIVRLGIPVPTAAQGESFTSVPWLCAMRDIPTNPSVPKKLMYLTLDYGVAVDPKKLHRAINDVELMREMLIGSGTTWQEMLEFQRIPSVNIQAQVPFERKDEAKALGFRWEELHTDTGTLRFPKKWVKRIKHNKLEEEQQAATFPIIVL